MDHFDRGKDRDNALYRTLASNIGSSQSSSSGGLQGKVQR